MAQTPEKTVEEKLRELYRLQLIDSQIDEIEILKGELPMEVSDLEDEIAGLETRIERLQGSVTDLEQEIGRHDANVADSERLIERYEEQMNNVQNNREYEALMKETEMSRLEIQLSEKKKRSSLEELDARRATLEKATERRDAKLQDLEIKREELKSIITKTEKQEKKLRNQSNKQRKTIEDRLLRAYDKTRNNYRNGLAVVTVERNACGGCFNAIPPQQQLEISQRKRILACEHCSRVLVDDTILEEKEAEEVS